MPEHGVRYGQSVRSTDVQQQNTTRVQVRGAIHLSHTPPGLTVTATVSIEVTQEDEGIPRRTTFPLRTPKRVKSRTAVWAVGTDNSQDPSPNPKVEGGYPLVSRGTLQRTGKQELLNLVQQLRLLPHQKGDISRPELASAAAGDSPCSCMFDLPQSKLPSKIAKPKQII